MQKVLPPEQVAEHLQVTPKTVREWLKTGYIKGFNLGGNEWRVRERDLADFVDQAVGVQPDIEEPDEEPLTTEDLAAVREGDQAWRICDAG